MVTQDPSPSTLPCCCPTFTRVWPAVAEGCHHHDILPRCHRKIKTFPERTAQERQSRSGTTLVPAQLRTYLFIDLPLKLDHLVLHANVELLQVLCRAGLNLQCLQLLPGLHAPVVALQDDGGTPDPAEASAGQPATGVLLEDGGFVLCKDLQNTGQKWDNQGRKVTCKGSSSLGLAATRHSTLPNLPLKGLLLQAGVSR